MPDEKLYRLDTSVLSTDALVRLLKPYIPQSLPILGTLLSNKSSHALHIYTSFDISSIPPPTLFSIVTLAESDMQSRLFCSAECSPDPPTSDQTAHVARITLAFLSQPQIFASRDSSPEFARAFMGSVHEKWIECLRLYVAAERSPSKCSKYLRPPHVLSPSSASLPENMSVGQIAASDIETIQRTSHVPRTREYLLSRSHTSACVRVQDDGSEGERAVGWVLQHNDGSLGALYVEPAYRHMGLARRLMQELVGLAGGEAVGDWCWVDVVGSNGDGHKFFSSAEGWKMGWECYWIRLEVAR